MSSKARKLEKKIIETFAFPVEMYTDTIGSLVISNYIFSKGKYNNYKLTDLWKSYIKGKLEVGYIDQPDFIDKTLEVFGMTRAPELQLAMVVSAYNTLFLPVYNDDIMPIREDGFINWTMRHGKAYYIDFNEVLEAKVEVNE